ncbi:uncharacterized protein JCM10292_006268 [Rhodotorula paludigena]|uniref:uncharacterized protein n=1 Tax=Rhodotorula paludigena TaxID=86838 RepID=UPI003181569C
MSGPGPGYQRGPYDPPATAHRPYGGAPAPADDGASSSFYSPQQSQQGFYGQPHEHQHTLSTVSEKDEPAPSPEMSRNEHQPWGDPQQQQQYGGYYDQHQYDQQQYDQQYDYAQQQAQDYGQGVYGQQQQYDQSGDSAQQQQPFEIPHYPGWVYNPATNSYDPDPSYQADGAAAGGNEQEAYGAQNGAAGEQQAQGEYGYSYGDPQAQQQDQGAYGAYGNGYEQQGGHEQQQHQQQYGGDAHQTGGYDTSDPYADDGFDSYTHQHQQQGFDPYAADQPTPQAEAVDPYSADSNPYADEAQQADPFSQQQDTADPYGAASNDPFGQSSNDPFGQSSNDPYSTPANDPYASEPQQQAPSPAPQPQQQEQQYDPYAPTNARAAAPPHAAAAPPARNAYSPPPAQQQYTSFSAAFDQPSDGQYDPYAPRGQQQKQQRAAAQPTQPQQQAYDPYAPSQPAPSTTSQQRPQQQQQHEQQQQAAYDPYASQRSPPMQQQPFAASSTKPPSERSAASPPPQRTALSPPPRSSSAASNASARQAAAAPPPRATPAAAPPKRDAPAPIQATPARAGDAAPIPSPRQTVPSQMASPRAEAAAALASPPPQHRPLPAQAAKQAPSAQQQQQQPPKQAPLQRAAPGSAFDIPPPRNPPAARAPPRGAPATASQSSAVKAPPPQQPPQQQTKAQQPPTAAATAPAPFAPPHAAPAREAFSAPSQPVLPPSQRKPPPSSSGLRPPVQRAPHQRGASAFGSDSPYGALPTGPPTSSYEPPQTVEQIKEEEEEEEIPPAQQEPEKPEDFVPSWMQATAAPPARGPFFPKSESEEPAPPPSAPAPAPAPTTAGRAPPPPRGAQQGPPPARRPPADLADSMQKMSLNEQAPPPPPPQQRQQQPPPPRGPGAGGPPPRQGPQGGAAPPPRAGPGAPPTRGAGPPPPAQAKQQQPPKQQQQPGGPAPPARGPPPQGQSQARPPVQQKTLQQTQQQQRGPAPPQARAPPPKLQQAQQQFMSPERAQVPQLQFEAPSPEVRGPRQDRFDYAGGRSSPMPMAGIEETPEPSEQDDYFGASGASEAPTTQTGESSQYGADDSIVYHGTEDERATGQTTPSSQYGGDWKADSENTQGYDYISPQHQQQAAHPQPYDPYAPAGLTPRDPYAPNQPGLQDPYKPRGDVPSRASTFTPPAGARGSTTYVASPRKPLQPPSTGQPMARANSYDAPRSRTPTNDSYAPYSQPQQQQVPYNPYAAPVSRPTSAMNGGEPADLGLERRTAPVVSFGFGGRLVVVFPNGGRPSYGMDSSNPYGVAAPGAQPSSPTTVHIRKLADLVPSQGPSGATSFPGPIFLDGGKANSGKKRKEATAWLTQRISELEQEAVYARGAAPPGFGGDEAAERRRKIETRLLLVKLVHVMIEHEGKLVGSPDVDDAVRALFAPTPIVDENGLLPTADQLASSAAKAPSTNTAPFVQYGVSGANLDEMQTYLLRGERREAVRYALDHKMWAHAFIIASCVDTDCWKDVTIEFLRSELTPSPESAAPGAEGREALRVAYGMFAGLGAESMHQFFPPRSLGPNASGLLPAAPIGNGASTPLSRSNTEVAVPMSEATLEKWQETVGMIIANRTAGDSAALTSLGDALAANGWTDAAHICYLLSPQTSLAMGFGLPGSRITLVGSTPQVNSTNLEIESIQLTELVEFALSLVPTVKGHEPFVGFPHLQAFRLYHAAVLADAGQIAQAHKYTEAIVNTLKLATKPSPFYHPRLVAQIKALAERVGASGAVKEGGSWISRKVPRPTVNSLWSTFEGGFNKFVSGDDEPSAEQLAAKAEVAKAANGQSVGAFSHFSSISPGSTSGTLSRAQSSTDLVSANLLHVNPPARPASATGPTSPLATAPPIQQHQSPGPPPVKRAPFKTHHARSSSLGAFAGYDYNPTAPPPWQSYTPPTLNRTGSDKPEAARIAEGLTASPRAARDDASAPARRPQFGPVDEQMQEDEEGFISPMAHLTPSVSPAPAAMRQMSLQQQTHRRMTTAEELADLGIGNSKSKKPAFDTLDEELEAEEGGAPMPERKEAAPEAGSSADAVKPSLAPGSAAPGDPPTIKPSKSWLGGWFKREASPAQQQGPGPVRAKLGDDKSFYYDEKLKRWVNKNGPNEEAPAAVVPPPRAATASPSKGLRNGSPRFGGDTPPVPPMPPRSATMGAPPPLSRSATSADLRGDSRPPSAAGLPTRPPSATGSMPPRSAGGTPVEGGSGRAGARKKPKYVVVAP